MCWLISFVKHFLKLTNILLTSNIFDLIISNRKVVMILKDRIKKLRRELDLTQQEFADKIGISRGNIGAYEVGKNAPSDAVISLICTKFNVNENWLRHGNGEMFAELDMEDQLMAWAGKVLGGQDSKFKKRFVTMLMGLSDSEWEFLEKKAKELAADDTEKRGLNISPAPNTS